MGLVYLPTLLVDFYGNLNVRKYTIHGSYGYRLAVTNFTIFHGTELIGSIIRGLNFAHRHRCSVEPEALQRREELLPRYLVFAAVGCWWKTMDLFVGDFWVVDGWFRVLAPNQK